jgi:hypothetical protein
MTTQSLTSVNAQNVVVFLTCQIAALNTIIMTDGRCQLIQKFIALNVKMMDVLMISFSVVTKMNKRRGYPTTELAIAGGIEQMAQVESVGVDQSAVDANLRHIAASEAMARSNAESRQMMTRLRSKMQVEPLTPEELSSRVYPGRKY